MSVSVVGNLSLEPFLTPSIGEPLGTLIGTATLDGDATGGTQIITWTLGSFVYVVRMVSARIVAGATVPLHLQISTGYAAGGVSEAFTHSQDQVASGAGLASGATFIPPSIFCNPRENAVSVSVELLNVNTIRVLAAFRALVFPENVLQVADPAVLARFII